MALQEHLYVQDDTEPDSDDDDRSGAEGRQNVPAEPPTDEESDGDDDEEDYFSAEEEGDEFENDPRAKVLSVQDLEKLLIIRAPDLKGEIIQERNATSLTDYSRF